MSIQKLQQGGTPGKIYVLAHTPEVDVKEQQEYAATLKKWARELDVLSKKDFASVIADPETREDARVVMLTFSEEFEDRPIDVSVIDSDPFAYFKANPELEDYAKDFFKSTAQQHRGAAASAENRLKDVGPKGTDQTFVKEYNREGKKALSGVFGESELIEVESGKLETALEKVPKGASVMFMDHASGKRMFGEDIQEFIRKLSAKDPKVCVGGTCAGAHNTLFTQDLRDALPAESELLLDFNDWTGFDTSKVGMESILSPAVSIPSRKYGGLMKYVKKKQLGGPGQGSGGGGGYGQGDDVAGNEMLADLLNTFGGNDFTFQDAVNFGRTPALRGAFLPALENDDPDQFMNSILGRFSTELQATDPTAQKRQLLEKLGWSIPKHLQQAPSDVSSLNTQYQDLSGILNMFGGLFEGQLGGSLGLASRIRGATGAPGLTQTNKLAARMGFRDDSPFRFLNAIRIPGNTISMNNVSTPLQLIPDRGTPVQAAPNSGTHRFPGATSVLEIPQAQDGGTVYTTDPNDPRLQTYRDNLNRAVDVRKTLKRRSDFFLNSPNDEFLSSMKSGEFENESVNKNYDLKKLSDPMLLATRRIYDPEKGEFLNSHLMQTIEIPEFPSQKVELVQRRERFDTPEIGATESKIKQNRGRTVKTKVNPQVDMKGPVERVQDFEGVPNLKIVSRRNERGEFVPWAVENENGHRIGYEEFKRSGYGGFQYPDEQMRRRKNMDSNKRRGGAVKRKPRRYQFGSTIGENLQAAAVPVQLEVEELVVTPDLDIINTRAKEKHKDMPKDLVTDVFNPDDYVFSADPKMTLSRKDAENISFGFGEYEYDETDDPKDLPEELTMTKFFKKGEDKLTFGEIARRIRKDYPVQKGHDSFDDRSSYLNKEHRFPYLQALVYLNERKRNKNTPTTPGQAPELPFTVTFQNPYDNATTTEIAEATDPDLHNPARTVIRGGASAPPPAMQGGGPIADILPSVIGLPFKIADTITGIFAANKQKKEAQRLKELTETSLREGAAGSRANAGLGSLLALSAVLGQDPTVDAPQLDESVIRAMNFRLPQSLFSRTASAISAGSQPSIDAVLAQSGDFTAAADDIARINAGNASAIAGLGLNAARENAAIRKQFLSSLSNVRNQQAVYNADASNRTRGNVNRNIIGAANVGVNRLNTVDRIDQGLRSGLLANEYGAASNNLQAIQNFNSSLSSGLGALAQTGAQMASQIPYAPPNTTPLDPNQFRPDPPALMSTTPGLQPIPPLTQRPTFGPYSYPPPPFNPWSFGREGGYVGTLNTVSKKRA